MTADLIAFLRARLDEDGRTALGAAAGGHASWRGYGAGDVGAWTIYDDQWTVASVAVYDHDQALSGQPGAVGPRYRSAAADDTATHIARHDPARVLAEVDAKRRQLDAFDEYGTHDTWDLIDTALRLLALPYATHPDYQKTWAP